MNKCYESFHLMRDSSVLYRAAVRDMCQTLFSKAVATDRQFRQHLDIATMKR